VKIWIISSDPFLYDFEKMAKNWPVSSVTLISAVSKFGFGFMGHLNFVREYLRFKPEIILTDHGYTGFPIIKFINRFQKNKFKLNTYLRGNYWLEKRLRGE
jgi:hypothetical protein